MEKRTRKPKPAITTIKPLTGFVSTPLLSLYPISTCALETNITILTIPMENGEYCKSLEPILIAQCQGSCGASYDQSAVYFEDDASGKAILHLGECKCCKGLTGSWKSYEVTKVW